MQVPRGFCPDRCCRQKKMSEISSSTGTTRELDGQLQLGLQTVKFVPAY